MLLPSGPMGFTGRESLPKAPLDVENLWVFPGLKFLCPIPRVYDPRSVFIFPPRVMFTDSVLIPALDGTLKLGDENDSRLLVLWLLNFLRDIFVCSYNVSFSL